MRFGVWEDSPTARCAPRVAHHHFCWRRRCSSSPKAACFACWEAPRLTSCDTSEGEFLDAINRNEVDVVTHSIVIRSPDDDASPWPEMDTCEAPIMPPVERRPLEGARAASGMDRPTTVGRSCEFLVIGIGTPPRTGLRQE